MDQQSINQYLKMWGKNLYNEPLVRLVWSDEQRELRRGEFNEFYGSIFIREVRGVREVLKYPWIQHRWVLERWFPPQAVYNSELPESNKGSYEPIYVFQDTSGESTPLNMRVVELICEAMFNRSPDREDIKVGIKEYLDKKDREETKDLEDGLDISSPIGSLLSTGEGIAYGKHKGGN